MTWLRDNNTHCGRDCQHGRQIGKCTDCDLIEAEKEIEKLKAENGKLRELLSREGKLCSETD